MGRKGTVIVRDREGTWTYSLVRTSKREKGLRPTWGVVMRSPRQAERGADGTLVAKRLPKDRAMAELREYVDDHLNETLDAVAGVRP